LYAHPGDLQNAFHAVYVDPGHIGGGRCFS
jgi:hypothetical protein